MIEQLCLNGALLAGVKEVFQTMISSNTEFCRDKQNIEGDSFLSLITFKGNLEGCLTIYCSVPCARTIALKMLAMEPSEQLSEEEICDALGEVTSMIMDKIKPQLQIKTGNITVSIPTVVTGSKLNNSLGERAAKTSVIVKLKREYFAELSMLYRDTA